MPNNVRYAAARCGLWHIVIKCTSQSNRTCTRAALFFTSFHSHTSRWHLASQNYQMTHSIPDMPPILHEFWLRTLDFPQNPSLLPKTPLSKPPLIPYSTLIHFTKCEYKVTIYATRHSLINMHLIFTGIWTTYRHFTYHIICIGCSASVQSKLFLKSNNFKSAQENAFSFNFNFNWIIEYICSDFDRHIRLRFFAEQFLIAERL